MPRQQKYDYFEGFVKMTDHSTRAAELLAKCLKEFDADALPEKMREMHSIEHSEDIAKHELLEHLVKEFITPIEREDIVTLAQKLDDVTDAIEDVLMTMYMFRITKLMPYAVEFTGIIEKACAQQRIMLEEFRRFRKSSEIKGFVVEINRMEEEGDKLYMTAMRELFAPGVDALTALIWKTLYDRLECCADAIENVADVVESVVMKNS